MAAEYRSKQRTRRDRVGEYHEEFSLVSRENLKTVKMDSAKGEVDGVPRTIEIKG